MPFGIPFMSRDTDEVILRDPLRLMVKQIYGCRSSQISDASRHVFAQRTDFENPSQRCSREGRGKELKALKCRELILVNHFPALNEMPNGILKRAVLTEVD